MKLFYSDIGRCKKVKRIILDDSELFCFDQDAGKHDHCIMCPLFLDDETIFFYRHQFDLYSKAAMN